MRNKITTFGLVGFLSVISPIDTVQSSFASGIGDIIQLGSGFKMAIGHTGVTKATPDILPKGCRKVYMKIPGNDLFVHSTLVCSCGPQKDISRLTKNIQEK